MKNITFISTVHRKNGKCNAEELHKIIKEVSPEVVFLEALENTYSKYEQQLFSSYGIYHDKLEIHAIQIYQHNSCFTYVPVLDNGLSDSFKNRFNQIDNNIQYDNMLHNFNSLESKLGFQFLNSSESIELQEQMRKFESLLLNNNELDEVFVRDIEIYEDTMIHNIQTFCKENQFDKAVFLCGVAHRKSIIKKIESFNRKEKKDINWITYGN